MIYQVQEMLYIERGGKQQLQDEIKAYNPLVPKGNELVATLMFEIDNEKKRKDFLTSVGGIEHKIFLKIGDMKVLLNQKMIPKEHLMTEKPHLFIFFISNLTKKIDDFYQ